MTRDEQIDACNCRCSNPEGRSEHGCECVCHFTRDARNSPAGTLVVCEYCKFPHPKDDDGVTCRFPKTI